MIKNGILHFSDHKIRLCRVIGWSAKYDIDYSTGYVCIGLYLDNGEVMLLDIGYWSKDDQGGEQTRRIDESHKCIDNLLTEYFEEKK